MTSPYRLFVELPNCAKFRGNGDVADVRVDLDRFYELLIEAPAPVAPVAHANGDGITLQAETTRTAVDATSPSPTDELDQTTLDRLFSRDKNGTVSLRALPHGDKAETDALVALIYGAARLANEEQVTGSRLMKAAAQSGLHQVDRIDRALQPAIGQYVTTAGFKKGRRYGLTNPGISRAQAILTGILG